MKNELCIAVTPRVIVAAVGALLQLKDMLRTLTPDRLVSLGCS